MPNYKYKCADAGGKLTKGTAVAVNETALRDTLRGRDLFLLEYTEVEDTKPGRRFKTRELSEFCREMGTLLEAGVPLIRALVIMNQRDIKPRIKNVYVALYRALQQGQALSDAMEAQQGVFPTLLINMFRAGEASGQMDRTALKMAEHYEKADRMARKVRSSMAYPIVLAVITLLVLLLLFLFVLPKFFAIFEEMGTTLPGLTRFMLNFSVFLQGNWMWVLLGAVLLFAGFKALAQVPQVRIFLHRVRLRLPVAGKLFRTICTARFGRTMASLYTSGLSIMNTLQNAKGSVGNAYIEAQFPEMMQRVRSGESLSSAIGNIQGFDTKLAACITIGEETGKLDSMLSSTADAFDYDMENAMTRLSAIIEPLFIVVLAVIVALIVISVMMPLMSIYQTIGAGA